MLHNFLRGVFTEAYPPVMLLVANKYPVVYSHPEEWKDVSSCLSPPLSCAFQVLSLKSGNTMQLYKPVFSGDECDQESLKPLHKGNSLSLHIGSVCHAVMHGDTSEML